MWATATIPPDFVSDAPGFGAITAISHRFNLSGKQQQPAQASTDIDLYPDCRIRHGWHAGSTFTGVRKMKKRTIALVITGLMMQAPLFADEQPGPIDMTSLKSTASGVLIGGLLAGPPGMLVGLAGGALVADTQNSKQEVAALQESLDQTQQERDQAQARIARRHQAYKALMTTEQSRLDAMQSGFSLCLGFRTGSADIEPRISNQLTSLAIMLKAFPELKLQVLARADRRGSDNYNQTLSQERADAVAKRLVAAGLPQDRIVIRYIGESGAIYPVEDFEGLGFDRTVQLTLVRGDAS
jgi:outer membrane protein OmpA-like peptidoglycan-associated protein